MNDDRSSTNRKGETMKKIFAVAILALPGCMGSMGYQGMNADQIKALGKEANISCVDGTTVWGRVRNVFVNLDKAVIDKGGIEVTPDCSIKVMNERLFAPPKIADPKLPALPELQWAK